MNVTPIEWTTFSANPLKYRDAAGNIVWGCIHVSPGCRHCYSEALAKRYGRGGPFSLPVMNGLTPFLDDAELHKMRSAKQIGGLPVAGSRCFIGDMTDIFGEWVSDDLLNRLFSDTLEIRTDVTWQILTKRAKRMHEYLSWRWGGGRIPLRHIHLGVSVENQHFADERILLLLQTPAAVRFVSYEPALEYVNFRPWVNVLDWIIFGLESGGGARSGDADWGRDLLAACEGARARPFMKQLGANGFDSARTASGASESLCFRDRKGGDMAEWPEDLRIRQFPSR